MSFKMFYEEPCLKKWLIVFAFCSPDHLPLHSLLPKALGIQGFLAQNLCTPGFYVVTILAPQVAKGSIASGAPTPASTKWVSKKQPTGTG